jgi:hypothetical protein
MDQNQPPVLNQVPPRQPQEINYESQLNNKNNAGSSIIAILLLIFLFPIGIIYMWIAAPWSKGLKWFLTFIFIILPIGLLVAIMSLSSKGSDTISAPSSSQNVQEFSNYQATSINISFSYPNGWVIQDRGGAIIIASQEIQSENGKSYENRIDIQKYDTKTANTTLREYLINKNKQQQMNSVARDSDFKDLGKTTNGYELVKLSNGYFISNWQEIISINYPFGLDSNVIDKINNSLTLN